MSESNQQSVWTELHGDDTSWRKRIVGDISDAYVVPRYAEVFHQYFSGGPPLEFLELGSGTADISQEIIKKNKNVIKRYVLSEYFDNGVKWLRAKGFEAIRLDACDISLPDQSFDVTVSLDVMHHVPDQRRMAVEMMRVSRGTCLLVESNGRSVFRKLKEFTPAHRAAGERSFTPSQYKSFFEHHHGYTLVHFEIFPFLFPFKVPQRLLPLLIRFNRWIERVPLIRWQCSSVVIFLRYKRTA